MQALMACALTNMRNTHLIVSIFRGILMAGLPAALLMGTLPPALNALPAQGVTPINNRDYAPAVAKLINTARKNISIMLYQARYYPEHPDSITNMFVADLIRARQRGVEVRVIVDTGEWNPGGAKNQYNTDFVDRLTTAGVQIWEDNPGDVSHQKVIMADDVVTVVSSHNWLHYSLTSNNEVAAVVYSPEVNAWFRRYFDNRCAEGHPRANAQPATAATTETAEIPAMAAFASTAETSAVELGLTCQPVVAVEPLANRRFYPAVHDAFLSASKNIDVVERSIDIYDTPPMRGKRALLPGEPLSETNVLVDDLVSARQRGVNVRVVMDKSDIFDNSKNSKTAEYLQERGVPVYEDDPKVQTHAKLLILDDDKTILGSTNWTYPAIELGNEASILIISRDINKVYRDYVEGILRSGRSFTPETKSIWENSKGPTDTE